MISYPNMVRQFMRKHDQPISNYPRLVEYKLAMFRLDLIREELKELELAIDNGSIYDIADALADLKYVVFGTDLTYGIPADTIFDEVHRSNMTKDIKQRGPGDLKVQKGVLYEAPRIRMFIDQAVKVGTYDANIHAKEHK